MWLFETARKPDGDEQNASISWASCFCSAPGTSNPVPNIPRSIAAAYRLEPNNLVNKASLVAVHEKWEPPRAAVALDDPAEAAGFLAARLQNRITEEAGGCTDRPSNI